MSELAGNLLLVDDDKARRYVLATWLRRAGHTVTEVGTGQEALSKAGAAELVLLDVNLPDLSGLEVCRMIKSDPRTAAVPVIQVSATAVGVADRARGLTLGADAYLVEPTEPAELLATVTAALRYSRARQRAERTAAMLAGLAGAALDINAAETFDGLAAAAAVGAARIFATHAVLTLRGRLPGRRPDQARQAAGLHRDRPRGHLRRRGHADPAPAGAVGGGWRRGPALLRRRAPGGADPAAQLPARDAASDSGDGDGVPLPARERSGRGRRRLLRGAAVAGRDPGRHR